MVRIACLLVALWATLPSAVCASVCAELASTDHCAHESETEPTAPSHDDCASCVDVVAASGTSTAGSTGATLDLGLFLPSGMGAAVVPLPAAARSPGDPGRWLQPPFRQANPPLLN